MKKNFLIALLVFVLLAFLGIFGFFYLPPQTKQETVVEKPKVEQKKTESEEFFSYSKDALTAECKANSKVMCAVDFAVKCTIDPDFEGCKESRLPRYIFMRDESLNRPTEISFTVSKIKPVNAELIEVHTDSVCNGTWFGLCQGRVIYVLVPQEDTWRVKDIYAIENRKM